MIGVDTDVALDGGLLGKAEDRLGAGERLRALSGRTHEVLSGVVVIAAGEEEGRLARTAVTFRELSETEIERLPRIRRMGRPRRRLRGPGPRLRVRRPGGG